jgi:hypothetical protein
MPNIHVPGFSDRSTPPVNPVGAEVEATLQAFVEYGFHRPADITASALMAGLGRPFLPQEMPPAEHLPDVGFDTKQYFATVVQPELAHGIRQSDERTFKLAHHMGRVIGANGVDGPLMKFHPPLQIEDKVIKVDGHEVPYAAENGCVIEYGMGLNGLFSHVKNARADRYHVYGIHRSRAEVTVIRGALEYMGLSEGQIHVVDRGIAKRVDELLKSREHTEADIVIASRVHGAGPELRHGLAKSVGLLRKDGLLVARGPQHYSKGFDYNSVASRIKTNRQFEVLVDHPFTDYAGGEHLDASRLIVARKI